MPFKVKLFTYRAIDAMIQFKRAHQLEVGAELRGMIKEHFIENTIKTLEELNDHYYLRVLSSFLDSDRDLEVSSSASAQLSFKEKVDVADFLNNFGEKELRDRRKQREAEKTEDLLLDSVVKLMVLKTLVFKYWPDQDHLAKAFERSIRLMYLNFKNNSISSFWEVGKAYDMSDLQKTACEVRTSDSGSAMDLQLVEDDLHFVLVQKESSKSSFYKVVIKELIYFIDYGLTEKEKMIYCLNQNRVAAAHQKRQIYLRFSRANQANSIFNLLKSKSVSMVKQLSLFLKGRPS